MNLAKKIVLFLLLCIPATGAWCYVEAYQEENRLQRVNVSQLSLMKLDQREIFQLEGFYVREEAPVLYKDHEFVLVDSSESSNENSNVILLRRSADLDASLAERMVSNVVQGSAVRTAEFSWERAMQMGLDVSVTDPENFLVLDVDRLEQMSRLNGILFATLVSSGYGFVMAMFVLNMIDTNEFKKGQRRGRVRCQLALFELKQSSTRQHAWKSF